MAIDKQAWDPTPVQYTTLGMTVSWVLAVVTQSFLLGKDSAWGTLKKMVLLPLNGQFNWDLWTPLLLWVAIPAIVFLVGITMAKPYRKEAMGVGVVVLTSILVFGDLAIRPFG